MHMRLPAELWLAVALFGGHPAAASLAHACRALYRVVHGCVLCHPAPRRLVGLSAGQRNRVLALTLVPPFGGCPGDGMLVAALRGFINLQTLRLDLSGSVAPRCAVRVLRPLTTVRPGRLVSLTLCLDQAALGDGGVTAVADVLSAHRDLTFLHLGLEGNGIGDDGLAILAGALGGLARVHALQLHLRDNEIGNAGVRALRMAWPPSAERVFLELGANALVGPAAGRELGRLVNRPFRDLWLLASPNRMGADAAAAFAAASPHLRGHSTVVVELGDCPTHTHTLSLQQAP